MGKEAPVTQEQVAGARTELEIISQPSCWRQAAELAGSVAGALPAPGNLLWVNAARHGLADPELHMAAIY